MIYVFLSAQLEMMNGRVQDLKAALQVKEEVKSH